MLVWYDVNRRILPWRAPEGRKADPYGVWLSEIMLQQTTVQAVGSYYRKFLARWPNVEALAAASLDDVLAAWAGLGYYARARNLHAAAKMVAGKLGGKFPQTIEELRKIPGIGPYTAGAIAAIVFDVKAAAVDANAERVIARYFAVREPLAQAKPKLRALTESILPDTRAGDFAQALMDLGSLICTPKRPVCTNCPWFSDCEARKLGIQEMLPVRNEKSQRPLKRGAAFVARDKAGAVLLIKRPEKGLLGGMRQPPLGPWTERFPSAKEAMLQVPFAADWRKLSGIVRHGFTHFELEVEVYVANVDKRPRTIRACHPRPSDGRERQPKDALRGEKDQGGALSRKQDRPGSLSLARAYGPPSSNVMPEMLWTTDLDNAALPTVMRKIVFHALDDGGPLFHQVKSARKR